MERKKQSIVISGAILSSLWRETSVHESDCDGLLFGNVIQQTISEMTDGLTIHSSNITYAIQRFITLQTPLLSHFNPISGQLDLKSMKELEMINSPLHQSSNLVLLGWFKYRRNSPRILSYKEKIIFNAFQNEFKQFLPTHLADLPVNSIFALLSESTTNVLFSFEYKVFQNNGFNLFEAKELEILNLNTFPMKPASKEKQFSSIESNQFQNLKTLLPLNLTHVPPQHVVELEQFYSEEVAKRIQKCVLELDIAETQISNLEQSIAEKRKSTKRPIDLTNIGSPQIHNYQLDLT